MAIIDNFTKEELEQIVKDCTSYRELAKKVGYVSIGNNGKTIQNRLDQLNISTEHFTGRAKGQEKRNEENVFCKNSTATQAVLRRWYVKGQYTEYKCAICGLPPIWNGQELRESNFSAVGRKYGVSDNAIRKWCASYGLPTKAKDYK